MLQDMPIGVLRGGNRPFLSYVWGQIELERILKQYHKIIGFLFCLGNNMYS